MVGNMHTWPRASKWSNHGTILIDSLSTTYTKLALECVCPVNTNLYTDIKHCKMQ